MPERARFADPAFAFLVCVAFAALTAFGVHHHELWRDEAQAWLIARTAPSFGEVLARLHYEGHPPLWYGLLFVLSRAWTTPEAMQILHLLIAWAAAWTFAAWAPFPRVLRAAVLLGYFFVYEFAVPARGYGAGVLLLFLACASIAHRRPSWTWGAALGLCAMTSAHALAVAAGVAVTAFLVEKHSSREHWAVLRRSAPGLALFSAGALIAIWSVIPAADIYGANGREVPFSWAPDGKLWLQALAGVVQGFTAEAISIPIPIAAIAGSAILLVLACVVLRRHSPASVGFATGSFALIAILYVGHSGAPRHHGFFYIAFLCGAWIASAIPLPSAAAGPRERWVLSAAVSTVLAAHVWGAWRAVQRDVLSPISHGKSVVELLRRSGRDEALLVVEPDMYGSSIAAYLDRPLYFPRGQRYGSYVTWDRSRGAYGPTPRSVVCRAHALAKSTGREVMILLGHRASMEEAQSLVHLEQVFLGSVTREDFFVYSLRNPGACAHDGA